MQDYWKTIYKQRMNEGTWLAKLMWGPNKKEEDLYRSTLTQSFKISFVHMQIIRSINILFLFTVMIGFFFITVKRGFYFLSFWAIATTFTAELLLFLSSGQNEIRRQKKESNMKVSRKYKGKLLWKWSIALYVSGWALSCASIISFVAIVSEDQICETVLRFGFEAWRSIFIIMSIFITPVALFIELIFNRIPVKFQHLLFPIGIFAIYVGSSAYLSAQMKEPVYGTNLNFKAFSPHRA
jgi:hypothetical protein